jgi:DNA-binding MarR family transcriptional regulator
MDRTTLTRNLKPLLAKGWIAVGKEKDERVRLISVTEAGRQLVAEATPLWRDAQTRIINGVGGEKLSSMIETLSLVVEKVRDG